MYVTNKWKHEHIQNNISGHLVQFFSRFVYESNEVWCAVVCVMLQVLMRCCLFVHTVEPKSLWNTWKQKHITVGVYELWRSKTSGIFGTLLVYPFCFQMKSILIQKEFSIRGDNKRERESLFLHTRFIRSESQVCRIRNVSSGKNFIKL